MKIHLANESKQSMGGGWTFMNNLRESMKLINAPIEFSGYDECDIYFVCGPTMVSRDMVTAAKESGKKVILRIDNIPRNSRNRNTGTTRLYDFAQIANWVIFQSKWAKSKLMPLVSAKRDNLNTVWNRKFYGAGVEGFDEKRSSIIINGVNTNIFKKDGEVIPKLTDKRYLIMRYNRDNNKRIEESFDRYTKEWIKNKNIELFIIGMYGPELISGFFDFYLGERYQYLAIVSNRQQLAMYMRSCDVMLWDSYSDGCPNQVLEARACGLEIEGSGINMSGTPEVLDTNLDITLERMGKEYLELFKKVNG